MSQILYDAVEKKKQRIGSQPEANKKNDDAG